MYSIPSRRIPSLSVDLTCRLKLKYLSDFHATCGIYSHIFSGAAGRFHVLVVSRKVVPPYARMVI
jgi:hypothetical protein